MKKPITIPQALNNFRLLLELSPKNSYPQYRNAVQQISAEILERGITTAPVQEAEENPRFVWILGSIHERFPDLPEFNGDNNLVLWDRQEQKAVVTVHDPYAQIICLETTRSVETQPLTNLENWLNGMGPGDLESEGIPGTVAYFTHER